MRRRTLIMSASAAALGFAGAAGSARAETARTLRFGTAQPADSPLGAGARTFAAELLRRTDGRYRIEQYPDAVLGSEVEMLRDVRHGTLDLAFITGTPLPDVVAEVGAFSIPFIFDGVSHAHDMLDGPVGQACLNKFQDSSLVALAWGENGMRQLTNSRRPIRTPADLKGLKLGVPQSAVALVGFETLGADAGALACPDLYSALETGRFDGQDNPVSTIQAARLWQVQRHLTLSNHSYDPAVILMSPKLHDALPDNDRDAFGEAARLAGLASRRFAAESLAMGAALLNQAGMEVVSAFDRALFVAALTPARQKFDDMFGAGLVGWIRDQNIA